MASVVTGAFGYIGRAIAGRLLEQGEEVRTVTSHPGKADPFGGKIPAAPYSFDRPEDLTAFLRGASVLYNTYWIRFPYGGMTFQTALRNTSTLFQCARRAGVGKIVHIGVTNAHADSPLPYYAGKALQEKALTDCGVPYRIVRPTLVFGRGDILVNNIAWLMRRIPMFPVFGSGDYRVQPVSVDDVADLAVAAAGEKTSGARDAAGPETFAFRDFVRLIAARIGVRVLWVPMPPGLGVFMGKAIAFALRDVLLTGDELRGLMGELLVSGEPPAGKVVFSQWLKENGGELGRVYASELARHYRWKPAGT